MSIEASLFRRVKTGNDQAAKLFLIKGTKLPVSDLMDLTSGHNSGKIFVRGESKLGEDVIGRIDVGSSSDIGTMTFLSQHRTESSATYEIDEKRHPAEVINSTILIIGERFLFTPIDRLKAILVPDDETEQPTDDLPLDTTVRDYRSRRLPDIVEDLMALFPENLTKDHLVINARFSDH